MPFRYEENNPVYDPAVREEETPHHQGSNKESAN